MWGGAENVALIVGPEGDSTPGECERIVEWGVLEITLGGRVLRVETAALSLVSVVGCALEV
jgi:RsmE family RNA methyltransferase